LVREAEEAVLSLVSKGASYDATHPVVIATLLHALTLTRQQGITITGKRRMDGDHISNLNSGGLNPSHPNPTPGSGPSHSPSSSPVSDHMIRAGVLFTYLQGLKDHVEDPRSASAKRLLPMCYHHMCAGYR